ncbi:uncharacterized protein Dana_GF13866, isoform E [Drosophila ananassae]|uniref:Uncharacterized protein, isoform A n=1 Tax=Drosophila ananassae TaxID=7217 RepID=B3N1C0_DROAN|nr:uncharacterized protein LOC6496701 [Drosophila ananassae]XP_044572019.1 uncharacterized protein LOC6496701 [Drosophila ananassae]XP_044572020.1 uncharacterized protein LOC6496701 [Drosophila ananassae]XP_044572021.1 uncharacterized protein LOC6496701 [Drosophila ananassae]XP_044572022.1 uncharacterized protein LOC6496701 [Drosophila ananassae]EDV33641.1 uncharacterized protein Dana_GF13866, isoform A [Drosophila ananassae]KPU74626.1 uncharacterized protein Dana_GF13866, isoform C [Drosophi
MAVARALAVSATSGVGQDIASDNSAQCRTLATKVRRKGPRPQRRLHPPLLQPIRLILTLTQHLRLLLWLLFCCCQLAQSVVEAECPAVCECKWKSGKESALCLNANLTHIPQPLDAGTQLLDLSGNEIQSIPDDSFASAQLLNLQKVYLARCHLKLIERHAFRKLINLVELDLSQNFLSAIPSLALFHVSELRELRLSGNPILLVPDDAFGHVPQLVKLELSDCRLGHIAIRAFSGLESSLEWLKLDGNRLSEVRSGTITSLASLHGLELAGNDWNCSCSLRPLRAWMLQQNIPSGIPPSCASPPRLSGRAWDKLDVDDFACVPQIVATDTTAHGVEGRNITMSCYVEGVPQPAVKWLLKNRLIANLSAGEGDTDSEPRTAAATQGRKTYVVNMLRNASNLTILTADMQDAGIYTCAAENKAGKVEASVTLAVSRRPPEAPWGVRIVLLGVIAALLFVGGSSLAAICFCSLQRRRKLRLWNSVPPVRRSESYEKIEMTGRTRPDLGGGASCGGGSATGAGLFPDPEEQSYLRAGHTPLSDSDAGQAAIVNPSAAGGAQRRNGDYLNVSTHCDDEEDEQQQHLHEHHSQHPQPTASPQKNQQRKGSQGRVVSAAGANNSPLLEETDLHIPRLIDISGTDSASSSISSQVDAAARLASFAGHSWKTTAIATTKIKSPHSKPATTNPVSTTPYVHYGGRRAADDGIATSVFCSEGQESDLFDSNYPDLLDIAKYALAQAQQQSQGQSHGQNPPMPNGSLCTLPRKLKTSGKYFCNSSDSQSALLADNSSKYGSSILGDGTFLNEAMGLGRRYSAESSYANYSSTATYTGGGQRANSFLNLVQSGAHKGPSGLLLGHLGQKPSLPSSPVQHQRSLSSAATPLLDFTALASRAAGAANSSVAAYDYHAAQLERFLEEYRNLQDQLCKMKETCDTIRKKETPLRVAVGQSAAQLADPVMYSAATHSPKPPMTGNLKAKTLLPGQTPEPPPYWLHRNAMLKRLNADGGANGGSGMAGDSPASQQSGQDIFKS